VNATIISDMICIRTNDFLRSSSTHTAVLAIECKPPAAFVSSVGKIQEVFRHPGPLIDEDPRKLRVQSVPKSPLLLLVKCGCEERT
jgi:hypothetical protein